MALRPGALLAALLALATYAGTARYGFVYDDHPVVRANPAAHDPLDWRAIAATPSWGAHNYRPLTTWTFAAQYALHGPWASGYHLVNVALHAAVSGLVVLTAGALGASVPAAWIAGALFAVHPVHTEAVAGIVGRAELLCALFMLLALGAHVRGDRAGWPWPSVVAVVACTAAGLLCKEYAFMLVVGLPVLDLLVRDDGSPARFHAGLRTRRTLVYAAVAIVAIAWLALRHAVRLHVAFALQPWMNPLAFVPAPVRVLTALRVQALAMRLLVLPFGLSPDYSGATIPLVTSLHDAAALVGVAAAAGVALLAVILWRRSRLALFWLVFAALAWAPVSNLLVAVWTIFGERLLYLPSIGVCVLAGMALDGACARLERPRLAALVAAGAVAAWMTGAQRAHAIWRNDLTLARAMVARAPESAHAHFVLGTILAKRGDLGAALAEFASSERLSPDYVGNLYNAGLARRARREYAAARRLLRRAVRLEPRNAAAWTALAATENDLGRPARALALLQHAHALVPPWAPLEVERGLTLHALGRRQDAAVAFRDALRLDPTEPIAQRALAQALPRT